MPVASTSVVATFAWGATPDDEVELLTDLWRAVRRDEAALAVMIVSKTATLRNGLFELHARSLDGGFCRSSLVVQYDPLRGEYVPYAIKRDGVVQRGIARVPELQPGVSPQNEASHKTPRDTPQQGRELAHDQKNNVAGLYTDGGRIKWAWPV